MSTRATRPSTNEVRVLELERARYAELFEGAPIGYVITDDAGVVREANRAAAELLAADPKALIGKPLAVFVPLDARRTFRERLLAVVAGEGPATWRMEMRARDEARVMVDVTVTPALGQSESESLRWMFQDVSERFAHEQRILRLASETEERILERTDVLLRQRELLEAVVENIPAGFAVVDHEAKPVVVNREALRMFGAETTADFAGWFDWEAYHLDGTPVDPDERPIVRTLRTGEVVRGELVEVVVAGRHAVFELSTGPLPSIAGASGGAVAVFRDVTTRLQTERAERDFVTNAAHELQSPLAAIVSAIEVLQSGAKDRSERDVFLGHIEREADRLARLVRALLILARTQVGLEPPRDELVAVCPLLEEVGAALHLAGGVELEVDCPTDLAMLTNRELVEQAIVNLAENAAKMTRSGRVTLTAKQLADRTVELSVIDTGPGIPASERPRVFERFYRADPSRSPGFGLGLSIVSAVADALAGEIELDSTVDAGTIIRLRLPDSAASLVEA